MPVAVCAFPESLEALLPCRTLHARSRLLAHLQKPHGDMFVLTPSRGSLLVGR